MKNEHLISGEFRFRVCMRVDPNMYGSPHQLLFLKRLQEYSKEELLKIIYNGSFKDVVIGISELNLETQTPS